MGKDNHEPDGGRNWTEAVDVDQDQESKRTSERRKESKQRRGKENKELRTYEEWTTDAMTEEDE